MALVRASPILGWFGRSAMRRFSMGREIGDPLFGLSEVWPTHGQEEKKRGALALRIEFETGVVLLDASDQ